MKYPSSVHPLRRAIFLLLNVKSKSISYNCCLQFSCSRRKRCSANSIIWMILLFYHFLYDYILSTISLYLLEVLVKLFLKQYDHISQCTSTVIKSSKRFLVVCLLDNYLLSNLASIQHNLFINSLNIYNIFLYVLYACSE